MVRKEAPADKRYGVKISMRDRPKIAERVKSEETLQSIADDYGVTRERIRQIGLKYGSVKNKMKAERRDALCLSLAEEILYYREAWQPVRWYLLEIDKRHFVDWLRREGMNHPDIESRWTVARHNLESKTGRFGPDGRVCVRCHTWMGWDRFYRSKVDPNGHARQCIECAKEMVVHYQNLRYVPKPTVTEKNCPKCGETKPRSAFNRSTVNNSGLQTYCVPCHRSFESQAHRYTQPD